MTIQTRTQAPVKQAARKRDETAPRSAQLVDDNRVEMVAQRRLHTLLNNSPQAAQAKAQQAVTGSSATASHLQSIAASMSQGAYRDKSLQRKEWEAAGSSNATAQRMHATPTRKNLVSGKWGREGSEEDIAALIDWAGSDGQLRKLLLFVTPANLDRLLSLSKNLPVAEVKTHVTEAVADAVDDAPPIPAFVAPSEESLWESVTERIDNALPAGNIERVAGAEKRAMLVVEGEIARLTHSIDNQDNAPANRTARNRERAALNALITALGTRLAHEDAERAKDTAFVVDKTALAARPEVLANADVATAIATIQRLGNTRNIVLDGAYSAGQIHAAAVIWRQLENERSITNFNVPGRDDKIKAKSRAGILEFNKVLACQVNGVEVLIHLKADAELVARMKAARIRGVETEINL